MTKRPKSTTPTDQDSPQGMDEFLQEMFQTSTGEADGMPTLDFLKSKFKTKSAAIRYLHEQGFSVNQIRNHLGLRYQHVRNVLKTQLKRGPNEDFHLGEGQMAPSIRGISQEGGDEDEEAR